MPRRSTIPFGPIIVTKGDYAGSLGLYDDDEGRTGMVCYLYRGRQAASTTAFVTTGLSEFAIVQARDVRVPTPHEAVAILALLQARVGMSELLDLASTGGLDALREAGLDAEIEAARHAARERGLDPLPRAQRAPPSLRLVKSDEEDCF